MTSLNAAQWEVAVSGTAGNAISFTQAMTLGANGNLLLGTTTDNGARLQVEGSGTFSGTSLKLGTQSDIVSTTGLLLGNDASTIEMVASTFSSGYGAKIEQADPGDGFTYTRLFGRANTTSWTQNLSINNSTGAATFSSSVTASNALITTGAVATNQTGGQFAYNGSSVSLLGAWGANTSTRGILSFYLSNSSGTTGNEYARLTDALFTVTPAATFSSSVTASLFLATSSTNAAIITSTGTVGYGLVASGSAGGARDIFLAGQSGFSNGFTVQYNGTSMVFQMRNGNLTVDGGSVTAANAGFISGTRAFLRQSSGGEAEVGSTSGGELRLFSNGVQQATITAGGNLLVGTTTDNGARLQVSGNVNARLYIVNEASANRGGLYPYNTVAGSGTDYSVGIFSEGEIFLAAGGSATKRFTMSTTGAATFSSTLGVAGGTQLATSSGNVLIGTTTDAGFKLLVNGTTYTGGFSPNATAYQGNVTMNTGTTYVYNASSGSHTFTLQSASGTNQIFIVKNASSRSLTIATTGGQAIIDNAGASTTTFTLAANKAMIIQQDGGSTNYIISIY
jgi:hypothetical protein